MALTRPVLSKMSAFDATQNYTFNFSVTGGNQVVGNNLVITNVSTNVDIYNTTIDNFAYTHLILYNSTTPVFTNGVQYKAKIRTKDSDGNYSDFSDYILFYCYSNPTIDITNLTSGIANNQTFTFLGSYTGADTIKNYLFTLYDTNMVQLGVSPLVYSEDISATFVLDNNTEYYIKLTCTSQTGVIVNKIIKFLASYVAPTISAELVLTNVQDEGAVNISIIASEIDGEGGNYTFENNDWINLKSTSAEVRFTEGLSNIIGDYILKLHFKNITENVVFLTITSSTGNIKLKYYDKRFHAFKTSTNGIASHFINNTDITFTSTDKVCVELKMINDLIDVYASLYS